MSYCVNCGVELDRAVKKCPLCRTPVINPNELQKEKENTTFPEKIGTVEPVKRKDFAILISVILACTAVSCVLLNYFIWTPNKWSLLVVGFCGILWVASVPPLLKENMKLRVLTLINGIMVCIYLALIGMFTDSFDWVLELGMPIALIVLILTEIFLSIAKHMKSILVRIITIFTEIAVLCIAIELLIEHANLQKLALHWSSIVLTVCGVIVIALITMLSRRRMRNEIQRRFHL